MPPRRVSSFTGFDRLTSLSRASSSSSASSDRQVRVHSLPPGGLPRGLRRVPSWESIPGSQLNRRSPSPMPRGFVFGNNHSSISTPSSNPGAPSKGVIISRVASLIDQTTRLEFTMSDSTPPQDKNENQQILLESDAYASPITSTSNNITASNNRESVTSSDLDTAGNSLYSLESQQRGGRLNLGLWQPEEESRRRRGGGRYARRPTFRSTDRELQELLEGLSPPPPLPPQQPQPSVPPQQQHLPHLPPPPELSESSSSPQAHDARPTLEYQPRKQVFEPSSEKELEGLEVVGLRSEDGERIYPGSHSSSGSSTPEKKRTPIPTRDAPEEAETRVTRRQNELPVAIIPQTSMELERPNLIVKPVQYFEPPNNERLAIEYYPLGDDENDWTDEESWHCSDGEWPDASEYDSDEEEDFGCIGLFHEPYEEMLVAGKGFNTVWVEEVDKWPVPDEIKILGYRVIGRLGEEQEDEEDEDEDEDGDVIDVRFEKNENHKLHRENDWLHGSDPIDDDDEWEDE
ncbi:hypothetical protein TWF788_001629 [Orbilia oligospora]|uniref:Transcription factor Iwr1 domain-containing protein n=1 Tax=Orbilia oligospora TaxID=2813651 RepID=A0A7C8P177_ORBOL|nr:hypothetical protein TWF788_001629 [Orbilia oligospora]